LRGRNFSSAVLITIILDIVIFANAIAYTLVSGFGWYFTFDSGEPLSITDSAEETFAEAKADGKTIDIIFCMYEDDVKYHDMGSFVYRTAKMLEEKYPDFINLRFVNALTRIEEENGALFDFEKYRTQENESTGETITNQFTESSVIVDCKKTDGNNSNRHSQLHNDVCTAQNNNQSDVRLCTSHLLHTELKLLVHALP
jgi:hypothetical protein